MFAAHRNHITGVNLLFLVIYLKVSEVLKSPCDYKLKILLTGFLYKLLAHKKVEKKIFLCKER